MINSPEKERVLRRIFVLSAICCRADLEDDDDIQYAEDTFQDLLDWLDEYQVFSESEEDEETFIRSPIRKILKDKVRTYSWRAEGLAILSWAIGAMPLPKYDQQTSAYDYADPVGFFNEPIVPKNLLDFNILQNYSDVLEGIQGRLHQYIYRQEKWQKGSFALEGWFGSDYENYIRVGKGDLVVRGVRVSDLPISVAEECYSIALERRIAVNWLLGDHYLYNKCTADL